jgi:hypothetical protein
MLFVPYTKQSTNKRTMFCPKYLYSRYTLQSLRDHHQGKRTKSRCINCNWLLCAQLTHSVSTRCLVKKNEVKCCYSVALWQPAYSTNTSSNDTASHPRTPELISNAAATASDFASCDAGGRKGGGVHEAKN